MINPLDVPMVYAVRRENSIKTVYDSRTNIVSTPTSPPCRDDKGLSLWGKFFRSMSRLPVSNGVDEHDKTKPAPGFLLFPPPVHTASNTNYPLELKSADLNIKLNTVAHHTDEFHVTKQIKNGYLAVRRGQHFLIDVTFYREYDPANDDLTVSFEIGYQPSVSNLTKIVMPLVNSDKEITNAKGWWAKLESRDGNRLKLRINSSANAIVGPWNMKVVTSVKNQQTGVGSSKNVMDSQSLIRNFYILFNPWCSDDLVYMPDEKERDEYILNDIGKIWRGSANALRPMYWSYGQFEDDILDACMYVLDGSRLPMAQRSSPLQMARVVAQMVNSVDDNGVIVGNWTNSFLGGTPPTDWTGSTKILRQYVQTGQPVLFGQCWVFAAVATTILRCLGIPTRVVTNYSSAHDTGTTISVNTYFKSNGKIELDRTRDTKWTYHTWNECWMQRPDLPHGYGGWQAVDATPQEKTDGMYRVGPASVRAIREGEVGFCFETSCLFAEVNADKCYWLCNDDGNDTLINVNRDDIGRLILTKKPGRNFENVSDDDFLNITETYKFRPSSRDERDAVMNALLPGHTSEITAMSEENGKNSKNDLEFSLQMKKVMKVGSDIEVDLKIDNKSDNQRNVKLWMRVEAGCYHGGELYKIKALNGLIFNFQPNESRVANLPLTLQDYMGKSFNHTFVISVLARVKETGQVFAVTDDFCLSMPAINIKVSPEVKLNELTKIVLEFNNPLPVTLTHCKFVLDGPGIVDQINVPCSNVAPRGQALAEFEVTPSKLGKSKIILAHFTSDQLQDVDGSTSVTVK